MRRSLFNAKHLQPSRVVSPDKGLRFYERPQPARHPTDDRGRGHWRMRGRWPDCRSRRIVKTHFGCSHQILLSRVFHDILIHIFESIVCTWELYTLEQSMEHMHGALVVKCHNIKMFVVAYSQDSACLFRLCRAQNTRHMLYTPFKCVQGSSTQIVSRADSPIVKDLRQPG